MADADGNHLKVVGEQGQFVERAAGGRLSAGDTCRDRTVQRGPERSSEREEVFVGRIAAVGIGVIAIALAIVGGKGLNIQFLVSLVFAVAASANFPALVLAVTWRRFTTAGPLTGVAAGLLSSITLIVLSPAVWAGPASAAPVSLTNPAIISIPLGFLACVAGTLLSRDRRAESIYAELRVRAESGIGAEIAGLGEAPGRSRRRTPRQPPLRSSSPACRQGVPGTSR